MSDKPAKRILKKDQKYGGSDKPTAVRLGAKLDSRVEKKMTSTGRDKSDVIRTAVSNGLKSVTRIRKVSK